MGPMNVQYSAEGSTKLFGSVEYATPSTILSKIATPTDILASSAIINSTQSYLGTYIGEIYDGQVLSNNNSVNVMAPNIPFVVTQSVGKETENVVQIEDDKLKQAVEEVQKSGSPLPLIKEQLWCKIQSNRLAQGKPELKLPEHEEPKNYPLTPEEIENREKRKENNRVSAKKCRQKKKNETTNLFKERQNLERKNRELKRKIKDLEKMKSYYWHELTTNCPVETLKSEDFYQHLPSDWELSLGDGSTSIDDGA